MASSFIRRGKANHDRSSRSGAATDARAACSCGEPDDRAESVRTVAWTPHGLGPMTTAAMQTRRFGNGPAVA